MPPLTVLDAGKKKDSFGSNEVGKTLNLTSVNPPERKDQEFIQKTVTIVPAETKFASSGNREKSSPQPALSIGKITVEVVLSTPKVQTQQRIIYRTMNQSTPKAGHKGASKLIFGLGQL